MKKILTVLFFAAALQASPVASLDLGLAKVKTESKDSRDNFYVNYDFITSDNGLAFGAGLNTLFYEIPIVDYNQKKYAYLLGPEIKAAYTWDRLTLKAGVGYEVHRIRYKNYLGPSYSLSADINIYKKIGVGIRYKRFKSSYQSGTYGSAYIGYISLKFGAK